MSPPAPLDNSVSKFIGKVFFIENPLYFLGEELSYFGYRGYQREVIERVTLDYS
jgi:hypothetical protein